MPSSPNTSVITTNGSSLTDAAGNTWSLLNGQVAVDGAVDPTTANVVEMAYVNGQIWQENTSFLWWAKTSPVDSWSPTYGTSVNPLPSGNPASANDATVFLPGQVLTDANHNTWSISTTGQVLINGVADPTTANVVELAYVNGQVWQENGSFLWWAKSQPSDTWAPGPGTPDSPLPASANPVSANNTVALSPGETITDANHTTWTINTNGQVLINGAVDPTTARVTELAYENGQVWQENADNLWWAKTLPTDSWLPGPGTSTSPVPAGQIFTTAPAVTRTWVGGSDNSAADPANWSPAGTPLPGESLLVNAAATIDVAGHDLSDDRLTVQTNGQTPTTVNASAGAVLYLQDNFSALTVNAADPTTVNLGSIHGTLHTTGAALQFIGNSYVNGSTIFDNDLGGSGTVALTGAQGEGSLVEVKGAVASGLTFNLSAAAPVLTLQIDQPAEFAGTLAIGNNGGGDFGRVIFQGLQATSGTLSNGVLDLFNGNTLVDSVKVTGYTSTLTLDQTSVGVVLGQSHALVNEPNPVALPLTS